MSDHPAVRYLRDLFGPSTEHPVFICSLPNDKSVGDRGVRSLHTREPQDVYAFVNGHDRPGRGIYHAMSTIAAGRQRNKANCLETPALVVDLDFKDIESPSASVRGVLERLLCPPTSINHTGHGFHVVWQFREALPTQDYMERLESALRRLCDVIGGDLAVAHPAALLRLPGTHNTKNGEHTEVAVIAWSGRTYELDDLEDWLDIQSPMIRRKNAIRSQVHTMNGHGQESNPYLAAAAQLNFHPPIDVTQRLEQMTYQGAGEAGVHMTQLQVSASLVKQGVAFTDITDLLLAATQCAAGADGGNWNWTRERRNIERMCVTAEAKYGHGKRENEQKDEQTEMVDEMGAEPKGAIAGGEAPNDCVKATESAQRPPDPAESTADVIDLGAAREAVAAQVKRVAQRSKTKKHHVVAEAVKAAIAAAGEEFLFDSKHLCWWYQDGLWQFVDDFKSRINVETEKATFELGLMSDNRLCTEVRGLLERDPALQHSDPIPWDQHGKIPTLSGLVDPATFELSPAAKEHCCTWRVPWRFDATAQCPNWSRMLADCFADLPEDERSKTICSLQELLGAGLVDGRARGLRRALILIGGPSSGKSAILLVFGALFGNCISCTVGSLEDPHGLMPFRSRYPWIIDEAFNQGEWNVSDHVKTLITGEPVSVNVKNGPILRVIWSGPVYWASNHPPQFKDATAAIVSRLVPIHCRAAFNDEAPVGVAKWAANAGFAGPGQWIAATEMEGVLRWAVEGLRRARANRAITLSEDSRLEKQIIFADANLAQRFLEECAEFGADFNVRNADFCLAVSSWFAANRGEGGGRLPSNDSIGRQLAALHDRRIRQHRTKTDRWIWGFRLNEEGLKHFRHGKTARIYEGKTIGTSADDTPAESLMQPESVGDTCFEMKKEVSPSVTSVTDFGDTSDTCDTSQKKCHPTKNTKEPRF